MEYLANNDLEELEVEVNRALSWGWQPLGPYSMVMDGDTRIYCQTMVRYEA